MGDSKDVVMAPASSSGAMVVGPMGLGGLPGMGGTGGLKRRRVSFAADPSATGARVVGDPFAGVDPFDMDDDLESEEDETGDMADDPVSFAQDLLKDLESFALDSRVPSSLKQRLSDCLATQTATTFRRVLGQTSSLPAGATPVMSVTSPVATKTVPSTAPIPPSTNSSTTIQSSLRSASCLASPFSSA